MAGSPFTQPARSLGRLHPWSDLQMKKHHILVAIFLSITLSSVTAGRFKPEWTRGTAFTALTGTEQTRVLKEYEEQVEELADMLRSHTSAPLSIEQDQAIVGTARCVIDETMKGAVRQGMASTKPSDTEMERYFRRCTKQQAAKLEAALLKATPRMNVVDYVLDYRQNLGRTVFVNGSLLQRGELTLIHPPGRPSTYVLVDTRALSRDERKRILLTCSAGCAIQILGTVGDIAGQKGLVAIRLD